MYCSCCSAVVVKGERRHVVTQIPERNAEDKFLEITVEEDHGNKDGRFRSSVVRLSEGFLPKGTGTGHSAS